MQVKWVPGYYILNFLFAKIGNSLKSVKDTFERQIGSLNSKVDSWLTGVKVKNSITVTHFSEIFSVIMFC